jgi:anaerobic selenocysteine-containing dehydrogenase
LSYQQRSGLRRQDVGVTSCSDGRRWTKGRNGHPPTSGFTNVDRTVHISHKAVDPPGQAWSDLKIFAEYGHRMGFKDKDGQPLIKWTDEPEKAFNHWKSCTAVSGSNERE